MSAGMKFRIFLFAQQKRFNESFKSFSEEGRLPNSRGVELLQQRKIVQ